MFKHLKIKHFKSLEIQVKCTVNIKSIVYFIKLKNFITCRQASVSRFVYNLIVKLNTVYLVI